MTTEEAQRIYDETMKVEYARYKDDTAQAYDLYHKAIKPHQEVWELAIQPAKDRLKEAQRKAQEVYSKNINIAKRTNKGG